MLQETTKDLVAAMKAQELIYSEQITKSEIKIKELKSKIENIKLDNNPGYKGKFISKQNRFNYQRAEKVDRKLKKEELRSTEFEILHTQNEVLQQQISVLVEKVSDLVEQNSPLSQQLVKQQKVCL